MTQRKKSQQILLIMLMQIICLSINTTAITTGSEFLIPYNNPIQILTLYNNTNIYLDINNDQQIDYELNIKNTTSKEIQPPWQIKQASKIITSKPIILRQNNKIDYSPTAYEIKLTCLIPDILYHQHEFLLTKGKHTVISNTPTSIQLITNTNTTKINITKKLTLEINQPTIIKSNQKILATNNLCLNPSSSKTFFTTQNSITIYSTKKSKIQIDYNADNITDKTIITNNTKKINVLELNNFPPLTKIYSNESIFIIENHEWQHIFNNKINLQSYKKIPTEIIIPHYKSLEQNNNLKAKIFYHNHSINQNQKEITFASTKRIFGKNIIGFTKTTFRPAHKTITQISPNLIIPKLSHSFFIKNNNQKTIRIFNPTSTQNIKNITVLFNTNQTIYDINIKNLSNDNTIKKITTNKRTINFQNLTKNKYLEISWNNSKIKNYTIHIEQ